MEKEQNVAPLNKNKQTKINRLYIINYFQKSTESKTIKFILLFVKISKNGHILVFFCILPVYFGELSIHSKEGFQK